MIKSTSVRSEDWSYVVDHGRSLGLSRVGDGTASLESQRGGGGWWCRTACSRSRSAAPHRTCSCSGGVWGQRMISGKEPAGREAAYHVSRSWLYVS